MKKCAIIGGSIAGSLCAILLKQLGFDVSIFEKTSQQNIPDRGAGIWLPPQVIETLTQYGILPTDFPRLMIQHRPIYFYDHVKQHNKLITQHPIDAAAVYWLTLYQALEKARPDHVHYDSEIINITQQEESVTVITKKYEKHHFDFCICADGIGSIGRQLLFPEAKPHFTQTTVWRGTLAKTSPEIANMLLGNGIFYVCERGHFLFYAIPARECHNPQQDYIVNWLFYEYCDQQHELFQKEPALAQKNFAKGTLPPHFKQYLYKAVKKYLPKLACSLILETPKPFIQAMHEMAIPSYQRDRIALIGDSSIMLRAHTAAGASKAIVDALALHQYFKQHDNNISLALTSWNKAQHHQGMNQFQLGQVLGALFVTDMPDWQSIDKAQLDQKWQQIATEHCWYAKALLQ